MAMAALRHAARRIIRPPPPAIHRAAVAEERRRLLPRHIHGGSSADGRIFSLTEEQRRLLPRLFHGGSTAVGRICSRQFCSSQNMPKPGISPIKGKEGCGAATGPNAKHGEPNPITLKEKMKIVIETVHLITGFSAVLLKVMFIGIAMNLLIKDLSGPRYVPTIARVMFGPIEDLKELHELRPGGRKESIVPTIARVMFGPI